MFYTLSNVVFICTVLFIAIGIFNNVPGRFKDGTRWGYVFKYFPYIILPTMIVDYLPSVLKYGWILISIPILLGCGIGLYLHDLLPALYGLGWSLPLACTMAALDL